MSIWDALGSLGGSFLNYKSAEDANAANIAMNSQTNAANKALWEEQSRYNAPDQQMTRLAAAGLNPNLAYGQIAESRASNPPEMTAGHVEPPRLDLADSISKYQQVQNLQTLNAKNNIEISTAKSNAIKAASDADYTAWENTQLKNSGTLKSDPTIVKEVERGANVLGDFFKDTFKSLDSIKGPVGVSLQRGLAPYVGDAERNHILLPTVSPDQLDGGN